MISIEPVNSGVIQQEVYIRIVWGKANKGTAVLVKGGPGNREGRLESQG